MTIEKHWCPSCDRVIAVRAGRFVRHKVVPGVPDAGWCGWSGGVYEPIPVDNSVGPVSAGFFHGPRRRTKLERWWLRRAKRDLKMLLPKVAEYSAYDMVLIGKATADLIGFPEWENDEPTTDAVYAEIGCWWYILGKVGRAIGAIKEGRLPSADTALDTHVYAMMVQRIKATGGWPGKD